MFSARLKVLDQIIARTVYLARVDQQEFCSFPSRLRLLFQQVSLILKARSDSVKK